MTEEEIFGKLALMCSSAEHCQWDMTEKMRRRNIDAATQKAVIQRLVDDGYIDEERYCRAFVNDKVRYDRWGRRKIEQSLRLKHIAPDIYLPALDAVSTDEYVSALRPLIENKRKTVKARNAYEMKGKLVRFALQRGFTFDVINRCIDDCDDYITDDDD